MFNVAGSSGTSRAFERGEIKGVYELFKTVLFVFANLMKKVIKNISSVAH